MIIRRANATAAAIILVRGSFGSLPAISVSARRIDSRLALSLFMSMASSVLAKLPVVPHPELRTVTRNGVLRVCGTFRSQVRATRTLVVAQGKVALSGYLVAGPFKAISAKW